MEMTRRSLIQAGMAAGAATRVAAAATPRKLNAPVRIRRVATEEAWSIPEHLDALKSYGGSTWENLDVLNYRAMFSGGEYARALERRLLDVDERLAIMDANGIDMQVLSLTSPGVQLFDSATAVAMARLANDRLAAIVARRPERFAGLAAFAPQEPLAAVKEMERCVRQLGFTGFLVNSHTQDQYLDQPKFWPILEAAEALDAPIYIHPRCPADNMAGPFRDSHLRAAIWGFAIETGTHAVRLLTSPVFDRFPKLRIVLGHMGENVPYHIWRINHFWEREPEAYGAKTPPIESFKRNVWITTSGFAEAHGIRFAIDLLGADRVLWAIDYPYEDMPGFTEFMNTVTLDDMTRAKIFHRNAEALFKIKPSAV